MKRTAILRVALFAAALATAGCEPVKETFGSVRELHRFAVEVGEEFGGTPRASLNNGAFLTITLTNSGYEKESDERTQAVARQVAEYARDHYRGYRGLSTVTVELADERSAGFVRSARATTRTFTTAELGAPRK